MQVQAAGQRAERQIWRVKKLTGSRTWVEPKDGDGFVDEAMERVEGAESDLKVFDADIDECFELSSNVGCGRSKEWEPTPS